MCGRFNLRLTPAELQEFFDVLHVPLFTPRYNIAPTQPVLYVVAADKGRDCVFGPWGLRPPWAKSQVLINARAETVFETRAFRNAVRQRRCLVPASGFYEWTAVGKAKQPWHIWAKSGAPLAFAGFYESDGTVATMTTRPNAEMATLHDRMPVILPRAAWDHYLDPSVNAPEALAPLLTPLPDGSLLMRAVNTLVNNARNESAECIQPVE